MLLIAALLAATPLSPPDYGGPLGKWEGTPPDEVVTSAKAMWDVERCIVRRADKWGVPVVFREPDRPDHVALLWQQSNFGIRRIDLEKAGETLTLRRWGRAAELSDCI